MSTVLDVSAPTKSSKEILALRAINYDWTMHLRSIWRDPPFDSPEIATALRAEFQAALAEFENRSTTDSPLGWIVTGPAGSGKTHWLSICRQQAVARRMGFVLIDMTDVRSFWDTVLQGYLSSLQEQYVLGKFQQQVLIEKFLGLFKLQIPVTEMLQKLSNYSGEKLAGKVTAIIQAIRTRYPQEAIKYQDVIRALMSLTSQDMQVSSAGYSWLSANPVEDEMRKLLGFVKVQEQPMQIVQALSWMMSLCGPTVVVFDQLDPIVAQLHPKAQADTQLNTPEDLSSLAIIQEIANGFSKMYDLTYRTLSVISCIDNTLKTLETYIMGSWRGRYHEPKPLPTLNTAQVAASIIHPRVAAGCRTVDFVPPTPTWPVATAALEQIQGQTPRELLKICQTHRESCLRTNKVQELTSLVIKPTSDHVQSSKQSHAFDERYEALRQLVNIAELQEEANEDELLGPLLIAGSQALVREMTLPTGVDAAIDVFAGGKTTKTLHARIRLIDSRNNDREEHYCFRVLQRTHHLAFQARLKGVIDGSGIDPSLPFRHATVVRSNEFPGGPITKKLLDQYAKSGGKWHHPDTEEYRSLHAIRKMLEENAPGLDAWLQLRTPMSKLRLFREACAKLIEVDAENAPLESSKTASANDVQMSEQEPLAITTPPQPITTVDQKIKSTPSVEVEKKTFDNPSPAKTASLVPPICDRPAIDKIPLGQRLVGTQSQLVTLPLNLLEKHTVVLAGAGSGKTVLLKRLIEEAALAGIPSIVLDGANDLSALGDRWPTPPDSWTAADAQKANEYHAQADVTIWTPGRQSGNPLVFEPLPDLAAVADDGEQLQMAIDGAGEALAAMAISGNSNTATHKRGILRAALRFFAKQGGGSLRDLIALLTELPTEAGLGIAREAQLAKDIASTLLAKLEMNPLMRSSGQGFDPAVLFGDSKRLDNKTRVSVINLLGLASAEQRQQFVYQLGMTLFSWIKRFPNPPNRALRGLLIVDEAKDFIPSQKSLPSKTSLQLLAAQARKYHLGLILATQNPREIENTVIGNCATHFYGKASSPNSIEVIQDQLRVRGGRGDDIPTLKAGQFYCYNSEAGFSQPLKLQTPMCLSWHPQNPLDEEQILARAAASRQRMGL